MITNYNQSISHHNYFSTKILKYNTKHHLKYRGSLINVGVEKIIEEYFVKNAVLKTCKGSAFEWSHH